MSAVYEGMCQKAKEGKGILGSPAPYGYEYDDGILAEKDDELHIVKKIFGLYLSGNTLAEIVRWLEKKDVKTKKGKRWDKDSVPHTIKSFIL